MQELGVQNIVYSSYCDDALLKIKKASLDTAPFDLIICDLSFLSDHRERIITSGQELIKKVKAAYPEIKTIIFSVEEHPSIIRELWQEIEVDAYVCKDRRGLAELYKALQAVWDQKRYLPQSLYMLLKQSNTVVLTEYDEQLLHLLSQGYNQNNIEQYFKTQGVSPASRSSIEKRLKDLREEFEASTNVHLIAILKDYRLI